MRISDWSSDVCSSDLAPMLETITDRAIAQHAIAHRGHMIALVKLGEAGLDARCQNDAAGGDDFAVLERRAEMIALAIERGDATGDDLGAIAARMIGHPFAQILADDAIGEPRNIAGARDRKS